MTHSSPSEPSSHAPGPGGEAAPAPARRRRARRLAAPLLLLGTALALGGCDVNSLPTFGAFHGATEQGQDEFKLWFGTAIAGLAVAVVVWGLIFWSVFAYRRRRGNDGIPRQFHNNFRLEVIYTTLPIIIVGVLFYFTVVTENEITNVSSRPAEVVNVLAYRWGWQFSYESGAGKSQGVVVRTSAQPTLLAQPATSKQYPQMVLPKGVTTRIVLRTNDVIHGFYVPEFNFSRYAQSGIFNTFDFTPTTGGVFRGQCTQYCGLYHAEMLFSVRVVSPGQFQQWLSAEQAARA